MHRRLLLLSIFVLLFSSEGASSSDVFLMMRLRRTEALLARILDQLQSAPGEMDIHGDGSNDRGTDQESVFANTLVATPSNVNTRCLNDTSCSLYEFELSPKSHPLSSVHMWLPKTDTMVDMSVCWATSAERDRSMCEHLTNISEVKSVMDWGIYDLTNTLASEYSSRRLFCTVEIFGLSSEEHDQKPFLVATTKPSVTKRRKRRSAISAPSSNCHLVDFHISFQQIGWWWVVAPKGFNARMCSGRCSNQVNSFPSPHHQVLSTILNRNRSSGAREEEEWSPCCSATKLTPLDMIYVVANTTTSTNVTTASLVYRKIENMVTDSCGCW